MGSCCSKDPPEGAGDELGALNFYGSGCCGGGTPFTFKEGVCCEPGSPPTGDEWENAKPGLQSILEEVNNHVADTASGCCGYHGKLKKVEEDLTANGWLAKVNAHLSNYGLVADFHEFWRYNGQSSTEHLLLRVFTLDSAGGKKAAEPAPAPETMEPGA